MENIREWIGRVPGFREVTAIVEMVIALEKATKDEAIQALRLSVRGKSRIEIGRIGFNDESKAGGIEFLRRVAAAHEYDGNEKAETRGQG